MKSDCPTSGFHGSGGRGDALEPARDIRPGASPARRQAGPHWPPAGPTPRTADGHPDLTGNWQPNAIRQNVDMIGAGVEVPMLPGRRRSTTSTRPRSARTIPKRAACRPEFRA